MRLSWYQLVAVVPDEVAYGLLERAGQEIVLEQHAVLRGVMPTLDLALGLGMVRDAADVIHTLLFKPSCQIARDTVRSVAAEQSRSISDRRAVVS